MIIVRTPLRVSFIGGGSDYPGFFRQQPGAVIGTAVNLYVFIAVIQQTSLADFQYKLTYRDFEAVHAPGQLRHPVVRAVLEDCAWSGPGLHIATLSDVPARTGLGSSSSFTVAFLHALNLLRGRAVAPESLAHEAVRIEREVLRESGGWQDQFHAAYGGTALYSFTSDGVTRHCPETAALTDGLNNSMVLVPTGRPRASHEHAETTTRALTTATGASAAGEMVELARCTFADLKRQESPQVAVKTLAGAMNEAWDLKRRIMGGVLDSDVQDLIDHGLRHGALAGRLCGAGGSGFVLFLTEPGDRQAFLERAELEQGGAIETSEEGSTHGPTDWMRSATPLPGGIDF